MRLKSSEGKKQLESSLPPLQINKIDVESSELIKCKDDIFKFSKQIKEKKVSSSVIDISKNANSSGKPIQQLIKQREEIGQLVKESKQLCEKMQTLLLRQKTRPLLRTFSSFVTPLETKLTKESITPQLVGKIFIPPKASSSSSPPSSNQLVPVALDHHQLSQLHSLFVL